MVCVVDSWLGCSWSVVNVTYCRSAASELPFQADLGYMSIEKVKWYGEWRDIDHRTAQTVTLVTAYQWIKRYSCADTWETYPLRVGALLERS